MDSTGTHSPRRPRQSNQDVFTARGRESPKQEGKRGITVMTSATEGTDGQNQDKAAGPRAWRGWTAAGEEGHREHACGPRGRGVSRAAGGEALGQGSREAAPLEGVAPGQGSREAERLEAGCPGAGESRSHAAGGDPDALAEMVASRWPHQVD